MHSLCEVLENKAKSGAKHDRGKLAKMDIKTDSFLCKASYEVIGTLRNCQYLIIFDLQ